ncbi:MAG: MgtC/SapB family protein [Lawsonibacter sp.]|jgi:putative Mg2+ transporter-C (MgtC) family protein|nr:MgtC/SapB family protein [Lawsonibacter sp.]
MFPALNFLRQPDLLGMTIRVLLALVCGGAIGIERTGKRRPAGFRTHILICLGAAMTTATSQYLYIVMHYPISVSRMGAQVIAGVSFIGAGAIMMTKWQRVRGLTTAAGLWVVAIVGLCCGTAFYEGAVYATVLVLIAEVFFSKLEFHLLRDTREITVYAEYIKPSCLEDIVSRCHGLGVKIVDLEITKKSDSGGISCAVLSLLSRQGTGKEEILQKLADIEGVQTAIEA